MKGNWKQLYSVPVLAVFLCTDNLLLSKGTTLCVDDHTQHMNMRSVFVKNSNSVQLSPFVVAKFRHIRTTWIRTLV